MKYNLYNESNLSDHGVRKYDVLTGRFTSPDPLWEKYMGWTPYQNSGNNPLKIIDFNGLNWFTTEGGNIRWLDQQGDFSDMKSGINWKDMGNNFLFFNGSTLSLYKADKTKKSWPAVSGKLKDGKTNPESQLEKGGAIPEGTYTVDSKETLTARNSKGLIDFLKWIFKSPSWGLFVTPIRNLDGNMKYNYSRNNMFIHGGIEPGSAGCIDLTNNNYYFHLELQKIKDKIKLKVDY